MDGGLAGAHRQRRPIGHRTYGSPQVPGDRAERCRARLGGARRWRPAPRPDQVKKCLSHLNAAATAMVPSGAPTVRSPTLFAQKGCSMDTALAEATVGEDGAAGADPAAACSAERKQRPVAKHVGTRLAAASASPAGGAVTWPPSDRRDRHGQKLAVGA